jgi:F-type H+-transporting ATPase subunit epsilon
MAQDTFKFELVSPERLLMSEDVVHVVIPGAEGDFMVLAEHAPVLSTLRPGVLDVKAQDQDKRIFVKAGVVEVDQNRCTVLAQMAHDVADMSSDAIAKEIEVARAELDEAGDDHEKKRLAELTIEQLESLV